MIQITDTGNSDRVKGKHLTPGESIANGKCKFMAYSMEITTLQDVNAGYAEVCRLNPDSLHVCCAYRIPGRDFIKLQNFQDDGEAGAGRTMFQVLLHSKMFHRALYLVRYYGGKHLGPSRFQTITAACKSALARSTFNTITGKHQYVLDKPCQTRGENNPRRGHTRRQNRGNYSTVASPQPYGGNPWKTNGHSNHKPDWNRDKQDWDNYVQSQPWSASNMRQRSGSLGATSTGT